MNKQSILIVDDSPDMQELIAILLTGEPLDLRACYTGDEAIASALSLPPDLILLDVDLPGKDGFEVCRSLKNNPATTNIPVVFITGASSTDEKLRGLEMGAVDYIVKPFDYAELRARVHASLNLKRLMDLLAQKAQVLQASEERARILAFREQIRAQVLELITQGQPLDRIMRLLIESIERHDPSVIGAVLLNAQLHAPRLASVIVTSLQRGLYGFVERIAALTAEAGSQTLSDVDLLNDPAFREARQHIREHGLRRCWGMTVRIRHRDVSGAILLLRRDDVEPTESMTDLIKVASALVEIAVEHDRLNEQLMFQATRDALTELPNRMMFAERMKQVIPAAKRSGKSAAVLLIDVDHFKRINDTYGHHAGDEMLCQVAHRVKSRLRASDTLARMGGDEFAVILAEMSNPDDAIAVARSLVDTFNEPIDLQGRKQFLTLSIGTSVFPRDAEDVTTLLKNADLALYRAKDAGRNSAREFTSDMGQGSLERMELETDLRQAIARDEMILHYQPKVDANHRIVGVEALIRWNHPKHGTILPGKFIPLAEDNGLIIQLGRWVMEEAARQCREWMDAGAGIIPVAVNVSPLQFVQQDFISVVSNCLKIAGLAHPWLQIELTETLLMRNIRDALKKLAHLKQMNVMVAVDDFGTGYSSLAYLERLRLDELKIDRSFVQSIREADSQHIDSMATTNGRAIVNAVVALGKSLGLSVVAEGVETEEQRSFLLNIGCDRLQGFLFSPALPATNIEAMMLRQVRDSALAKSA